MSLPATMPGQSGTPRYTVAICKGSALVPETKALLRAWRPGEALGELADRVLRDNLLGKTTAYRARDIVRRVFARRFLAPTSSPAKHLKHLVVRRRVDQPFADLCLLYAARRDDLLRDAIVRLYWPAIAEGRLTLAVQDAVIFLRQAEGDGRIPQPCPNR